MAVLRALNDVEILQIMLIGKIREASVQAEFERHRQRAMPFPKTFPSAVCCG